MPARPPSGLSGCLGWRPCHSGTRGRAAAVGGPACVAPPVLPLESAQAAGAAQAAAAPIPRTPIPKPTARVPIRPAAMCMAKTYTTVAFSAVRSVCMSTTL